MLFNILSVNITTFYTFIEEAKNCRYVKYFCVKISNTYAMFVLSKEGTINNIVSIIEFNHQIKSMRYVCIFVGKLQVYTVLCTHYLVRCGI